MKELSINEVELVSGAIGFDDFVWGAGSSISGSLGSSATIGGTGIFAKTAGAAGSAWATSAFLGGALVGTYVVNPAINWASTNVWGGSGSLGGDIYDWLH